MRETRKRLVKLAIAGFTVLLNTGCNSEPTQSDVRLLFTAKRPILERIVEMSNEDYANSSVTRISPAFTRLENNWGWPRPSDELGITAERWGEYRKLFTEAETPYGLDRVGELYTGVMFAVWGFGIADNSFSKGVMFLPDETPSNVEGESQRILYKPLGGGWYYFEWSTW
jgi:hypothetical protein